MIRGARIDIHYNTSIPHPVNALSPDTGDCCAHKSSAQPFKNDYDECWKVVILWQS